MQVDDPDTRYVPELAGSVRLLCWTNGMSPDEIETPRGLTPREFAKRYGLAEGSVYKAIRNGEIPAVRVGVRYVCLPEEFERRAWMTQHPAAG